MAHISWLKAPRALLRAFLDFMYFSSFWSCNHCFLIPFFWKNHYVSEGLIRLFRQKKSPRIFPGGRSLWNLRFFVNFVKNKIAHISWLKAPRALLRAFLDFMYFSSFWSWNHCFWYHYFEKNTKFLRVGDAFSIKKFLAVLRGGNRS